MNSLTVLSSEIRQFDGFYSINDLHKVSGGAAKHRPNQFMRLDTTKALAEEIQCADMRSAYTVINGGPRRGTYACRELVYAYAMWIRPAFHLAVIRAFDAMQSAISQFPVITGDATQLAGKRFLVAFSDDGTQYSAKTIDPGCCVMTPKEFARALGDPNGLYLDTATLADMIVNCARRIESRVRA